MPPLNDSGHLKMTGKQFSAVKLLNSILKYLKSRLAARASVLENGTQNVMICVFYCELSMVTLAIAAIVRGNAICQPSRWWEGGGKSKRQFSIAFCVIGQLNRPRLDMLFTFHFSLSLFFTFFQWLCVEKFELFGQHAKRLHSCLALSICFYNWHPNGYITQHTNHHWNFFILLSQLLFEL